MMLQYDDPGLFQKKNYEQIRTKATEIHSHNCLYCDTTFPQSDDLIKHSRENKGFGSCLFVNIFGTKPGHHAVTSFTKPGPAI